MKANKTKVNKLKLKYFIKDLMLLAFFVLVYTFSVCFNGFSKTSYKLLTLIFYGLVGFVGAIILYNVVLLILKAVSCFSAKKHKKLIKKFRVFEITNERFNYNYKLSLQDNFKEYVSVIEKTLKNVASTCGYKGKYLHLNFTLNDALYFTKNTLNLLESKIDSILTMPIVKAFNLQDKPIGFIETTLNNLIEKETRKAEKPSLYARIFGKTLTTGITFLFKETIDNELNKVVNYVGAEWCIIYGKNNKKLLKKFAKEDKKRNELEVSK